MSGRTGPVPAPWTPLVTRKGWGISRVVTQAQVALIWEMQKSGLGRYVRGAQVRSARALEARGLGTVRDDGRGPGRYSNEDGERYWFELHPDVEIVQGGHP